MDLLVQTKCNFSEGKTFAEIPHFAGMEEHSAADDAIWVLSNSFVIFTMQSGFGLLESGTVRAKNEVNIMMKNVVDVVFGGFAYWLIGHGFNMGNFMNLSNPFCGVGLPFVAEVSSDKPENAHIGWHYADFLFQLSFATTSATIVSGAMAERSRLTGYLCSSFCSTIIYAFPSHWLWSPKGFLRALGVVDIAGAGGIHLTGGTMGLVATILMGPRRGRFDHEQAWCMSCPTNVLLGTFILWWGALGLNAGSSQGLSSGRWAKAAQSATATILSTIGGGVACVLIGRMYNKTFDISCLVTGMLSALMSITGMCSLAFTWHAILIGACASTVSAFVAPLLVHLRIDDPIGVVPIHFCGGIIGLLSPAFLLPPQMINLTDGKEYPVGLFYGGGLRLVGVQLLAIVIIMAWSGILSLFCIFTINKTIGLRLTSEEEEIGADFVEHRLLHHSTHGFGMQSLSVDECEMSRPEIDRNEKQNAGLLVSVIRKLSATPPDPRDKA